MKITNKVLRHSIDVILYNVLSSLNDEQTVLFLQIFREKLIESLNELELKSTVPSGEINNKE